MALRVYEETENDLHLSIVSTAHNNARYLTRYNFLFYTIEKIFLLLLILGTR